MMLIICVGIVACGGSGRFSEFKGFEEVNPEIQKSLFKIYNRIYPLREKGALESMDNFSDMVKKEDLDFIDLQYQKVKNIGNKEEYNELMLLRDSAYMSLYMVEASIAVDDQDEEAFKKTCTDLIKLMDWYYENFE